MTTQRHRYEDSWVVEQYADFEGLKRSEKYFVEKYLKKSDLIYDIGCGTGRTTLELSNLGFRVVGMDFSEAMVRFCHSKNPESNWQVNDATQTPYKDGSFDVCLFSYNGIDTITPLEGRLASIKEMSRIVKPGGLVIYSSRNIIFRVVNRFVQKSLYRAVRDNAAELKVQLTKNFRMFLQGYILQNTNLEGSLQVYTSTMNKNIKQFQSLAPQFTLVESIALNPQKKSWADYNLRSHMIYYVWQKPPSGIYG